ncbi:hypothetical protein MRX96_008512 [Rhipicephalus microplus]
MGVSRLRRAWGSPGRSGEARIPTPERHCDGPCPRQLADKHLTKLLLPCRSRVLCDCVVDSQGKSRGAAVTSCEEIACGAEYLAVAHQQIVDGRPPAEPVIYGNPQVAHLRAPLDWEAPE